MGMGTVGRGEIIDTVRYPAGTKRSGDNMSEEKIKAEENLVPEEAPVAETPVAPVDETPVEETKKGIDVPSIPLESFEIPDLGSKTDIGIENTYEGAVDFGVIGSGQCGGRIVKSFYDLGYKKAIAINTANSDLNPLALPENQKLKMGEEGSGKDMALGEKATKEAYQDIFDKMKDVFGSVDKIIVSVGFGGGTGAGGLATVIAIAQKYLGFLGHDKPETDVIVVAALPTAGELSSDLIANNNGTIREMMFDMAKKSSIGPLLLIDNSRIEKLYKGIPINKFWNTINDTITGLFQVLNYMAIQETEYTTFDREDYRTLLKTPGLAVMGATKFDLSKLKLSKALQDNFKKTLLCEDANYKTAKNAGCVVVADNESIANTSMDDINYGFDTIANLIGNATVYRGVYEVKSEGIRAYTFIAGMLPR